MNRSIFGCVEKIGCGEGVEPSSSGSKPDVLPVTPSRKNLGAQASSLLSFVWQIHGGRLEALRTQDRLVAVEGIEPTSLDYQSSAAHKWAQENLKSLGSINISCLTAR